MTSSDNPESVPKVAIDSKEVLPRQQKVIFKEMKVVMSRMLLNARVSTKPDSDVIGQLSNGSRVNVNLEKSVDGFCYIASKILPDGTKIPVHGYCPSEYISEEV